MSFGMFDKRCDVRRKKLGSELNDRRQPVESWPVVATGVACDYERLRVAQHGGAGANATIVNYAVAAPVDAPIRDGDQLLIAGLGERAITVVSATPMRDGLLDFLHIEGRATDFRDRLEAEGQDVAVLRNVNTVEPIRRDGFNRPIADYQPIAITRVIRQLTDSREVATPTGETVVADYNIFAAADADIRSSDRLRFPDGDYEIVAVGEGQGQHLPLRARRVG